LATKIRNFSCECVEPPYSFARRFLFALFKGVLNGFYVVFKSLKNILISLIVSQNIIRIFAARFGISQTGQKIK